MDNFGSTTSLSSIGYRTLDGTGNNTNNPSWGSAGVNFLRMIEAVYEDGISIPVSGLPNPREVSTIVSTQPIEDMPITGGMSALFVHWGQFVDHDITLSRDASGELFNIPVPITDPIFNPGGLPGIEIPLHRTTFDSSTGTDSDNPRDQINGITSFLDGSQVYGSDEVRAEFLRAEGGKLLLNSEGLLPLNNGEHENAGPGGDGAYLAGDIRANETVGLTSIHTVFARDHNFWVDHFASNNPDWDAETLYQEARNMVIAEIQHITYNEYLPVLLGDALPSYQGYNPNIDATISNEFATAAFRFGHTNVAKDIARIDEHGNVIPEGNLSLKEGFFSSVERIGNEGGIDPVLRGLVTVRAQEMDAFVINDLQNFLFGAPGAGGLDLAALNIQRGRDHGLADYNDMREALGLVAVVDFADITSNVDLQNALQNAYGTVDNIDLWIGGLAEDNVAGGMLGPVFQHILVDQFTRLRDGDSFWYEEVLTDEQLVMVQNTSLADILIRNTDIEQIQPDVLYAYNRICGDGSKDIMVGTEQSDLILGYENHDQLTGFGAKDMINGNQGNDDLQGNQGDDILRGGKGDDRIQGGKDNDTIYGDLGNDYANGNLGDDSIQGGLGNDLLRGGKGNDLVEGGDGDDTLWGDLGNDILSGGLGSDVFSFEALNGTDMITDFELAIDHIALSPAVGITTDNLLAAISYNEGNATIDLGDGNQITLLGVTNNGLTLEDFV